MLMLFSVVCFFIICGVVLIYFAVNQYIESTVESDSSLGAASLLIVFMCIVGIYVLIGVLLR